MLRSTTIKEYAYSLGFDIARITDAQGFPEAERVIKERITEGLMDGLPWFTEERAAVSCHPDALLPEARSIISLAMFYLTKTVGEGVERRGGSGVDEERGSLPPPAVGETCSINLHSTASARRKKEGTQPAAR